MINKQLRQLPITAIGVILLTLGTWSKAPTQAATIKADFFANLNQVEGNVPGVEVGTIVSGSILYETVPNQSDQIPLDFTLSIGSNQFTFEDVIQIRVLDFESSRGFDTKATLKPREGLVDLNDGISFEIFQEYEDSILILNLGKFSAFSNGFNLTREEVTTVPEPDMLVGTAIAGAMGWWLNRKRKVFCKLSKNKIIN